MKVTVCFGETKVVVPCGDGDIRITNLVEKAVQRYRKAAGKPVDHYVNVHTLKSYTDGGILDFDDSVSDVLDDREQIIALYEESGVLSTPQGGDGTSGSSVGSSSPDVFHSNRKYHPINIPNNSKPAHSLQPAHPLQPAHSLPVKQNLPITQPVASRSSPFLISDNKEPRDQNSRSNTVSSQSSSRNSVEVTEHDLNSVGTGLQVLSVRRDSEPNLAVSPDEEIANTTPVQKSNHIQLPTQPSSSLRRISDSSSDDERSPGFNRFSRDSSRQSLNSQNVLKWLKPGDEYPTHNGSNQLNKQSSTQTSNQTNDQSNIQFGQDNRREPLGQSQSPGDDRKTDLSSTMRIDLRSTDLPSTQTDLSTAQRELPTDNKLVLLKTEGGPLGIHVIPYRDETDRECGLLIQGIEPEGCVHRNGEIQTDDVIIEINKQSLKYVSFAQAQEIFRDALQDEVLHLRLQKSRPRSSQHTPSQSEIEIQQAPPTSYEPLTTSGSSITNNQPESFGTLPQHSPTSSQTTSHNANTNTRKLGKRINMQLTKGQEGLGFSITTRDNPAGGVAPIYVKNILPKGAAIKDGRLKSGDRLLEVNGHDMTGKSQDEVVTILRNTKRGSTVTLCVSRTEHNDSTNSLPRQMPKPVHQPDILSSTGQILTLNIPLNETGSAGLGVSVKGKTTTIDGEMKDLGIFIKAVIHGGAASKDGRLQINDQLLAVNDDDLKNKTNTEAMENLRQAMHIEGPTPGHIKLKVKREIEEITPNEISKDEMDGSNSIQKPTTLPDVASTPVGMHENKIQTPNIEESENPVIHRITNANTPKLRNESYHMATQNDSDDETPQLVPFAQSTLPVHKDNDIVMIEDDQHTTTYLQKTRTTTPIQPSDSSPIDKTVGVDSNKPHSLSIMGGIDVNKPRPISVVGGVGIAASIEGKHKRTEQVEKGSRSQSPQPSPDEKMNSFDREAMGRRSFSEKRRASNGRSKEITDKVKALREELTRTDVAEEKVGPRLGLERNSSFESLQGMVEQNYKPVAEPSIYKPPNRVARGRGCNESFRAAVDRSYVPQNPELMESVSEDEAHRSVSVSSSVNNIEPETQPLDKKNKKKKEKGLLSGLFRFGKARKSLEERNKSSSSALKSQHEDKKRLMNIADQQLAAEKDDESSEDETTVVQQKIQSYLKQINEKQKNATLDRGPAGPPEYGTYPRGERLRINPSVQVPPPVPPHGYELPHQNMTRGNSRDNAREDTRGGTRDNTREVNVSGTRADRLAHVRNEHQRKHHERKGRYPGEEQEDFYERKIKQRERDWESNGNGFEYVPRLKPITGTSNYMNRYSFYADPRYHDYQKSIPANNFTDRFNTPIYSSITKRSTRADLNPHHARFHSQDSTTRPFDSTSRSHHTAQQNVQSDYDEPHRADHSLYARVRKPPLGGVAPLHNNPARV